MAPDPDLIIDTDAFTWHVSRIRPGLPPPVAAFTPPDPATGFDRVLGPAQCPRGHYPAPGTIIRKWTPCDCPPAMAARTAGWGHDTVICRVCEDEGYRAVCGWPPHRPG